MLCYHVVEAYGNLARLLYIECAAGTHRHTTPFAHLIEL